MLPDSNSDRPVFIIEDSDMDLLILKHYLLKYKFTGEIVAFPLARPAVDRLNALVQSQQYNTAPKIIFVDINIPDMSGFDFLDQVKLLPGDLTEEIKIILISSSDELKDLERAKEYPFLYSYIIKPINKSAQFWENLKD